LQVLRALYFGYYAQQAILLPYLPLYFLGKEFDSVQIGILLTAGTFVAVFIQPVWGYISDRFQTVKALIVILWCGTIITSVGLFTANGFSATLIFVVVLYIFLIPSAPLLDSIAIKAAESTGANYGSFRLWGSIGFTLMALISGFILRLVGGVENIQYIYWTVWIIPFLLLIFLKDQKSEVTTRVTLQAVLTLIKNYPLLWFMLIVFIIMIPHRMNDSLLGVYMQDIGASAQMIGLAWAIAAGSEIPVFILIYRFMHRYHELSLLFIVSCIYSVRWLVYAFTDNPFIILILQASHSITFAVFWIVAVQYVDRLVPPHLRSTGQSLLSAVFLGLAGLVGGLAGGWLYDEAGGMAMYMFAVGLAVLSSMLLLFTQLRRKTI
jgi:PPP family 3-phenylpropionic acid transporter